jgi:hypothetical protein
MPKNRNSNSNLKQLGISASNSARKNKSSSGTDDESGAAQEIVPVNAATLCLYYLYSIKSIIGALCKDRNGNLHTYLLTFLLENNVISDLCNGFTFVIATLQSSLSSPPKTASADDSRGVGIEESIVDNAGRCALHAIPVFLQLFKLLVDREAVMNSPITAAMIDAREDQLPGDNFSLGGSTFYKHEFIYRLHHAIATKILSFYHNPIFVSLPLDFVDLWLQLISLVCESLQIPLPQPPGGLKKLASKKPSNSGIFFIFIF